MLTYINGRQHVLNFLPKNGVGAEIGVHLGDFSVQILHTSSPKKLIMIDPWKYDSSPQGKNTLYGGAKLDQHVLDMRYAGVKKRFAPQIEAGTIQIIRETSSDAVRHIADNSLDYVYIDGDHSFNAVVNDIQLYYPKVKQDGFIIGDDYMLGGWWGDGVVKAFSKCVYEYGMKIEFVIDAQICCKKISMPN